MSYGDATNIYEARGFHDIRKEIEEVERVMELEPAILLRTRSMLRVGS